MNVNGFYANEASISVTVGAINTYYYVPSGLTQSPVWLGLATFDNNREINIKVRGNYLVVWSMSLQCATNSQDMSGGVMVDASIQTNTINHAYNNVGVSKVASVSGNGLLSLSASNLVRLAVANHTAANNIVVEHANLSLLLVSRY